MELLSLQPKQGKSGKVTLNFDNSVTLENLVDNREMFNSSDYITFKRWAYYYAGLNPVTGISTKPRGDQPNINTDKHCLLQLQTLMPG